MLFFTGFLKSINIFVILKTVSIVFRLLANISVWLSNCFHITWPNFQHFHVDRKWKIPVLQNTHVGVDIKHPHYKSDDVFRWQTYDLLPVGINNWEVIWYRTSVLRPQLSTNSKKVIFYFLGAEKYDSIWSQLIIELIIYLKESDAIF